MGGHDHFHIYDSSGDSEYQLNSQVQFPLKVRADRGKGSIMLPSAGLSFEHTSGSGEKSQVKYTAITYTLDGTKEVKSGVLTAGDTLTFKDTELCTNLN